MNEFLQGLPLWSAKIGSLIIFGIVLVVVWRVPRSFIFNGAPDTSRWRDLRVWATLLIALQLLIYTVF